ncbi:MAG TPA: hypothetical protein VHB68_15790 [Steroidobacteraceae bacterium]|nr:hypothetical protein [Steroidobacteraceae bacterium]
MRIRALGAPALRELASPTPILPGRPLADGVHVNLVGSSSRNAAETDDELVKRAKFFVDYRPCARALAGELLIRVVES